MPEVDVVAVAEDAGEGTAAVAVAAVDGGRKEGRLVERRRYRKLLLEGK
jgi:hypothetical protein